MSPSQPPLSALPAPNDRDEEAAALHEYAVLRQRVDAFFAAVAARHPTALRCQAGCHGCCQAGLSVCAIEAAAICAHLRALPRVEVEHLRAQAVRRLHHTKAARPAEPAASCVFLRDDGHCAIYPVRPLVCRSQGLPLSYSAQLIPAQALRFSTQDGRAVVCCPLNFNQDTASVDGQAAALPQAADILDAERVDLLLALLNRRFLERTGQDAAHATQRSALADLVRMPDDCAPEPTQM